MTDLRQRLRQLVLQRRDGQADLAAARLRVIDAEQDNSGKSLPTLQQHVAALENRDAELAFEQRALSAEIAAAEAEMSDAPLTLFDAG